MKKIYYCKPFWKKCGIGSIILIEISISYSKLVVKSILYKTIIGFFCL